MGFLCEGLNLSICAAFGDQIVRFLEHCRRMQSVVLYTHTHTHSLPLLFFCVAPSFTVFFFFLFLCGYLPFVCLSCKISDGLCTITGLGRIML